MEENLMRKMVSREHIMRGSSSSSLHEKFQLLRSITKSHAVNKKSIILDATKYIQELKQKVERFNEEIIASPSEASSQHVDDPLPMVSVETLEKGFLIKVFSGKSCPGLLVSVLAAFDELSLNVHEATVSCTDSFCLQAVGEENDDSENVDAESVEEAVMQAIKNWRGSNYQQG